MLDRDSAFRGLLRAIRRGLDDVAAVLPVPIVADQHERFRRLVGATGRLDELWAGGRHAFERVAGRMVPGSNFGRGRSWSCRCDGAGGKAVAVCVVVGGAAVG
ncbi:hypothetical protein [Baekduia sp. Peel2402]|uniref:hypothetical protein n=1 Tax=Baekduia sp. Peel2402 TaxID=3458296 RepID=UPI00403EB0C7